MPLPPGAFFCHRLDRARHALDHVPLDRRLEHHIQDRQDVVAAEVETEAKGAHVGGQRHPDELLGTAGSGRDWQ